MLIVILFPLLILILTAVVFCRGHADDDGRCGMREQTSRCDKRELQARVDSLQDVLASAARSASHLPNAVRSVCVIDTSCFPRVLLYVSYLLEVV